MKDFFFNKLKLKLYDYNFLPYEDVIDPLLENVCYMFDALKHNELTLESVKDAQEACCKLLNIVEQFEKRVEEQSLLQA